MSNRAIFAFVVLVRYSQNTRNGSICVENAGKFVNCSGLMSLDSPGFKPKIAASISRTCVGLKSIICWMTLSGTVSHSIK